MSLSASLIPLCSFASLIFALSALAVLTKRHQTMKKLETARIVALQQKIDTALQDDYSPEAREAFLKALQTASLTTSLQVPRLQNLAKVDKQAPEKYKILSRLASQGMSAGEIASILGISPIEAGQLLSLSSMAKQGG